MSHEMNAAGRLGRAAAEAHDDRRSRRYWGSMEPPSSKIDFFNAVTASSADGDGTVATIRMYGPIDSWGGWWGISTEDVARVLDALPPSVEQIVLRINSPGGEVWEAMAILNMLGAHRASVIAVVDGIAASAASFIAAGCEETVMSPGSQMMLHSPSSIAWGNAREMRRTADFLDKLEESVIEVYVDKAGPNDWATILAHETWMTAADAVALGLADRVDTVPDAGPATTVGDDSDDDLELVIITSDPEDAAEIGRIQAAAASARATAPKPPSSSEPGTPIRKETVVAHDDPKAGVPERLGVTDAETLPTPADTTTPPPAEPPAPAPTASLPEGLIAIDATVLAEMQENARQGAAARAEQDRVRRDAIVAVALQTGRITALSSGDWRARLDKDETEYAAVLASLPENTVPVDEIGIGNASVDADAYPAHWKR